MRGLRLGLYYALVALLFAVSSGWGETISGANQVHPKYKDGELIVKYRDSSRAKGKTFALGGQGGDRIREFREFGMEHVKLRPGLSVAEAIKEYEADADVEYAEPNYTVQLLNVPGDPKFYSLWGLTRISAPAAWDTTTGSDAVVVAVIDTGIDYNHEDLKANLWVNQAELNGQPGVDDDGNGVVDDVYGYNALSDSGNPMDDNSHGTAVAGTIGAVGNNGAGVVGVNWNVRIMACKFINAAGYGYVSDAIRCLQYVRSARDRGVNVVATNNSWTSFAGSQALYDAIRMQRDILFVAAAGNFTASNDKAPGYPAGYYLPNLIAVAATDQSDKLAYFSNYGRRSVHVGAPGVSILSTVPGNAYRYLSGTSLAAPHVTGLAALIKAADANQDWRGIRNLILAGGEPLPSLDGMSITGRRIDAFASLSCLDSRVFSVLKFPTTLQTGVPATLSALSINCASPLGPVTVALSGGEVIELRDDGVSPDLAAGDGIFTADFTPVRTTELFHFSSPAGSETVDNLTPLSIVTRSLPVATVGIGYSQSLAAAGGMPPYTWSVTTGGLPPGLALDHSTGVISGAPTAVGPYSFTVEAKDARSVTVAKLYLITVVGPLTVTTPLLATGTIGRYCYLTLTAADGVKPYTWSVVAGVLPPGFSFYSTLGMIAGVPKTAGTYSITVQVKDARQATAIKALQITIVEPLRVTSALLPEGKVGVPYSTTLTAAGGTLPYKWSAAWGLPPGLALDPLTGVVSGTPTRDGTYYFYGQVKDAASAAATKLQRITVSTPLTIITTSLPQGTVGAFFSQTLAAAGGVSPRTWSVAVGSLPVGLRLNATTGLISGTPTAAGRYDFTIRVRDAQGATATNPLSMAVAIGALSIVTDTLPSGTVGTYYYKKLASLGGEPVYNWSPASGSLPAGLVLNAATGVISGTPATAGTYYFAVQVRDARGVTASRSFIMNVVIAPLTIGTTVMPTGSVGTYYFKMLAAMGGEPPSTWSLTWGSLPAGLRMSASTGAIYGTPTISGAFTFIVRITDTRGRSAEKQLLMNVL